LHPEDPERKWWSAKEAVVEPEPRFLLEQTVPSVVAPDVAAFAQQVNKLDWNSASRYSIAEYYETLYRREANGDLGLIEDWSPLALSAKTFDADNPSYFDLKYMDPSEQARWREAMNI
jgi:hypothetical protein